MPPLPIDAEAAAERIAGAFAGADAETAAILSAQQGELRARAGDLTGARADWEATRAAFETLGDVEGQAIAEEALAALAGAADRAWERREHLARAADLYRSRGDAAAEKRARAGLADTPGAGEDPDPRVPFQAPER